MHNITLTVIFALIGGILPACIWLWFWLKEDVEHPEPKKLIFLTFLLGMLVVPIALLGQLILSNIFLKNEEIQTFLPHAPFIGVIVMASWAFLEEFLKWIAAYFGGLHQRDNNEPVDVMIYMITAALGFAALENALFIFAPILDGDTATTLITTNMRFIGATLVHVASSALIGVLMAFAYFFKKPKQHHYLIVGFTLSVSLHTLFNFSIIKHQENLFTTFFAVWLVVLAVIVLFEKIKHIHLNKINE